MKHKIWQVNFMKHLLEMFMMSMNLKRMMILLRKRKVDQEFCFYFISQLAVILLLLEAGLFLVLCTYQSDSVINSGFEMPSFYDDNPHFKKKLILYGYETVIEYDFAHQIFKEPLPINVFDHSYGYIVNGDLRLLNLQKRFVNSRSKFKDGHIVLCNTNPSLEIKGSSEVEDFDV